MSRSLVVTCISILLIFGTATAQDAAPASEDGVNIPADPYNRGTPLRSSQGFIEAINDFDYETASEYLDTRNLLGEADALAPRELARRLAVIVRRGTFSDIAEFVDHPDGRRNDNLPDYRDSIGVLLDGDAEVELFMQRVPRGDGVFIWKVSNASVSVIPRLYATYGYAEWIETLRTKLPEATFLGYELFKWVIVLAFGIAIYLVVLIVGLLVRGALGHPDDETNKRIFRFIVLPFGLWLFIIAANGAFESLGRGTTIETVRQWSPIPVLLTIWVAFVAINLFRDIQSKRLIAKDRTGAALLLRPASNAIKSLILVAAILVYLDKIGLDITTVLAGLGVGGIAVALALQKPMEDVFGAITLYTQQPVRVGDFCRVGQQTGTIEEIGLRTTRMRTLANTVIAIPNARLANEAIDNISARQKILYRPTLRLRYDTTPEQLQSVLGGIRELFAGDTRLHQDDHRVRFKEIAEDALLVEAYAYADIDEWPLFLEIAEDLNIKILKIIDNSGTSLSLPAQSLHIERSSEVLA